MSSSQHVSMEVWQIICSHLIIKDIKECLLVCKKWNSFLRYFLAHEITIVLRGSNIQRLLKDLRFCANLRLRIETFLIFFKLDEYVHRQQFKEILSLCKNTKHIHFYAVLPIETTRMILNSTARLLPSIEFLKSLIFTKEFYMINYKFKNTITTLEIKGLQSLPAQFDDIIDYTSHFPKLTSLTVWRLNEFSGWILDFNRLLLSNPNLKVLALYGVNIQNRYTKNHIRRKNYPKLERMVIDAFDVNTSLLTIIIPQLTHLKMLWINVESLTRDLNTFDRDVLSDYKTYLKKSNSNLDEEFVHFQYSMMK